ncbi:MAG: TIGR01777 family oxidoreductase [Bacteroidetes bacterium]|nr:TIGR01777 family oxidoreductase [Bacteroidota bacterium]
MKNILITGGSGLVGKHLTAMLTQKGYQVAWLSRNPEKVSSIKSFFWDVIAEKLDPAAIEFADAIVHLAGAGIADKPWSDERKQEIVDSRVKSTELIIGQLERSAKLPKIVIAASAIGYYGTTTSSHVYTEIDPPGTDFLATTTQLWEEATGKFRDLGIKTIQYRLGVVLDAKDGALSKMALPVRFGFGAAFGTGRQFVPWIHMHDLCNLIVAGLEQSLPDGVYNAVAPAQNTNGELIKMIAGVLHRPYFLPPVPGFIMKLLLGEMSAMVLEGSAVSANKVLQTGFQFSFIELKVALEDLLVNHP